MNAPGTLPDLTPPAHVAQTKSISKNINPPLASLIHTRWCCLIRSVTDLTLSVSAVRQENEANEPPATKGRPCLAADPHCQS